MFDKAVRVGDTLKIGEIVGTVDYVGLRTRPTLDRTIVSVPNGQIANVNIEVLSVRDMFWFHHFLGLRYDTTSAQMRAVVEGVRGLLASFPGADPSTCACGSSAWVSFRSTSNCSRTSWRPTGDISSISAGPAASHHGGRRARRDRDRAAVADVDARRRAIGSGPAGGARRRAMDAGRPAALRKSSRLHAAAALDLQLRERSRQRRVDRRDFFVGDLVAQAGRGALARFLGPALRRCSRPRPPCR